MESLSLNSPILSFNPELNEPFLFPNKFLTNKLDSQVDYLHLILTAHVSPISTETPLHYAASLSDKLNSKIYLKREDMQPVHSFKCRGAFNKMRLLTPEQSKNGVICCSAGNHAQGVALAARHLKMSAIIVMPNSSPEIKRDAVKKLGGQVILHGKDFDEARIESKRLALLYNRTEIPPFDDPLVIAGFFYLIQVKELLPLKSFASTIHLLYLQSLFASVVVV